MGMKATGSGPRSWTRRAVLRAGGLGLGLLAAHLAGCRHGASGKTTGGRLAEIGPLGPPDANGLRLPPGFRSRVVAQAQRPVGASGFLWHNAPDGGAVFAHPEGGWVYVSNRETPAGGVNAIRFAGDGEVVDAYALLPENLSHMNCAGGVTPWQTWLSCEEWDGGVVWECDPFGLSAPLRHPALGSFAHEAAAVDPLTHVVYMTEDKPDGRFYRFTPLDPQLGGRADLSAGRLEVMAVVAEDGALGDADARGPWPVHWLPVPNPNPVQVPNQAPVNGIQPETPTRHQVPESAPFNGGEGIWHHDGQLYFTTKGDVRIWKLDLREQLLEVVYDDHAHGDTPVLDVVDNIVITPGGDLVISEDKPEANQQIVALTALGQVLPLVEVVGQAGSELTGPAFTPDGQHFYFSSQRGPVPNTPFFAGGITYCVSGPWLA